MSPVVGPAGEMSAAVLPEPPPTAGSLETAEQVTCTQGSPASLTVLSMSMFTMRWLGGQMSVGDREICSAGGVLSSASTTIWKLAEALLLELSWALQLTVVVPVG